MVLTGLPDDFRDIFSRVPSGIKKIQQDGDLRRSFLRALFDPFRDIRLFNLQKSRLDDPDPAFFLKLRGQGFDLFPGLGRFASVGNEQD